MTAMQPSTNRYLERPAPSALADVVNVILDKGLVIDAYVRVSLVGIELVTIDARIVIASVDTYLRFAQAVNRLDLNQTETSGIPELMEDIGEKGSKSKTSGAIEGVTEKAKGLFRSDDQDENEKEAQPSGQGGGDSSGSTDEESEREENRRRRREES